MRLDGGGWTKVGQEAALEGCRACFASRSGGFGSVLLQGVAGSWSAIRPGGSVFARPWPESPALCGAKAFRKCASDQRGRLGACKGLYGCFYCSVRS